MPGDPTVSHSISPAGYPASTIHALADAIFTGFLVAGHVSSDDVIQSLREKLKYHREVSLVLASALLTRFVFETHSTDECEEAITILDNLIASTPRDGTESLHTQASEMIALLALARSIFYSDPQYSEEAILRCRTALSLSSPDNQHRAVLTQALSILAEKRFKTFGLTNGLLEARFLNTEVVHLLSSSSRGHSGGMYASRRAYPLTTVLEKIDHLEGLLHRTTTGSLLQRTYLEELACWYDSKFSRTGDLAEIEKAIIYRRMLLDPSHSTHPLLFIPLSFLCDDLLIAFDSTHSMAYLEEAIVLYRRFLAMQDARALHFCVMRRLVTCLCLRWRLLRHRQDVEEIMRLCPMAVDDQYVSVADRYKFLCHWALLARQFRHPSVSTAYESAMSLMKPSLELAPIVQLQHARLVWMGHTCETMPLDYASHHISTGCHERAIEVLERGRSLLWSEMRGFRTEVDQPVGSQLLWAEKYAVVNHELKRLSISNRLGGDTDLDNGGGSREGSRMDPFSRLVTRQRKLLKERDTLTSRIRSLPGFDRFLIPPHFDTLRSAASRGPVIIINHSKWRCDILIVVRDSPISHIPTSNDFYYRANRLKDQLVNVRRGRDDVIGWGPYTNAVRYVLAGLYELVGQLVIERLRELGIPEQSRVWLCPTSAFCYLPLHAMGPIPSSSHERTRRYFCDLYIPSYTPTLSALIDSRKPIPGTSASGRGRSPLLLVAHHDRYPPGMRKEVKLVRGLRRARVSHLKEEKATAAGVLDGLQRHAFLHIAGSVKLKPSEPFEASIKLFGDERLTLRDIASCCLPAAEFAFLSASHTAALTDRSWPDEALHLSAAMLHCGFRSVIGTTWGMADMDGRHVCKHLYKSMFSKKRKKGEEVPPRHERAAKALRDAVQKLRTRKEVTVDRWVTYVHYGA
ncbi:CHAT domain-containing protein [Russula earlei]|uniref:CHAT domain-containing protein n=1 Tax=Russula earlei TaxID=71964 RepID=A0ACC0U660_9AGAM|nr:CHAT domain-containing protein [Russula earlei]